MSRNSLLETGGKSEGEVTVTGLDVDDNDNIDFEVDDGVKCKFAQVIFGAFAQYLM